MKQAKTDYYGSVENLLTRTIYEWDGVPAEHVVTNLQALKGSTYGVHWKFAGDQSYTESNIFEAVGNKVYSGENAIALLAADLGVNL